MDVRRRHARDPPGLTTLSDPSGTGSCYQRGAVPKDKQQFGFGRNVSGRAGRRGTLVAGFVVWGAL
jgi:hypothetical protein